MAKYYYPKKLHHSSGSDWFLVDDGSTLPFYSCGDDVIVAYLAVCHPNFSEVEVAPETLVGILEAELGKKSLDSEEYVAGYNHGVGFALEKALRFTPVPASEEVLLWFGYQVMKQCGFMTNDWKGWVRDQISLFYANNEDCRPFEQEVVSESYGVSNSGTESVTGVNLPDDEEVFEIGFGLLKTVVNECKGLGPVEDRHLKYWLERVGIKPVERGEPFTRREMKQFAFWCHTMGYFKGTSDLDAGLDHFLAPGSERPEPADPLEDIRKFVKFGVESCAAVEYDSAVNEEKKLIFGHLEEMLAGIGSVEVTSGVLGDIGSLKTDLVRAWGGDADSRFLEFSKRLRDIELELKAQVPQSIEEIVQYIRVNYSTNTVSDVLDGVLLRLRRLRVPEAKGDLGDVIRNMQVNAEHFGSAWAKTRVKSWISTLQSVKVGDFTEADLKAFANQTRWGKLDEDYLDSELAKFKDTKTND